MCSEKLPKVSSKVIEQQAITNPNSRLAASWLLSSRAEVLAGGAYPSRDTLHTIGLTESSYLIASGQAISIPGGFASPFATELATQFLQKFPDSSKVTLLGGVHGTYLPELKFGQEHPDFIGLESGSFITHHMLHVAETLCGASGGSMDRLREAVAKNIHQVLALSGSTRLNIKLIESLVGKRTSNPKISSLWAFDIHNNRSIDYLISREIESAEVNSESIDPQFKPGKINDSLRDLMDKGERILPIVCVDTRSGLLIPHPDYDNIDLEMIMELTQGGVFKRLFSPARNSLGAIGHTETPEGIVVDPEDLATLSMAHFALTNPSALARRMPGSNARHFSKASPLIVSGITPEFLSGPSGEKFASQVQGLLGVLDFRTYRWRANFFGEPRNTEWYQQIAGEVLDIDHQPGLHLILPQSEVGEALSQLRIKLPASFIEEHPMLHPNPTARSYSRRPDRPLGRIRSNI